MNQKIIIESLSMDLLRVALGLHRGSFKMAEKFKEEALKRGAELESLSLGAYTKKLLQRAKEGLSKFNDKSAEDLLMYSILFRNFAQSLTKSN